MGDLNIKDALVHLGGSISLYRMLIQGFKDKYSSIDLEIRDQLLNREIEDSRRLAHSMKGLSGNLGASDLQRYAKDLEEVIKSFMNIDIIEDDIDAILGKEWILFSEELKLIEKAIEQVLLATDEQLLSIDSSLELMTNTSDLSENEEDADLLTKELLISESKITIQALVRALNTYNYETIMNVLQSIDEELLTRCCLEQWDRIKCLIKEFEYDQAKEEILEGVLDEK